MNVEISNRLPNDIEIFSKVNKLDQNLIIGIDLIKDPSDQINYYHYFDDKTLIKESFQNNNSLPTYYYVQAYYLQFIDGIIYDQRSPITNKSNETQNIVLTGNEIAVSETIASQNQIRVGDIRQVNISRNTSPVIVNVTVKYIINEIDLILRETVVNYVGFDRLEKGIVMYSEEITFPNQSPKFLKFSTNSKSFNYSSSITTLRNSLIQSLTIYSLEYLLLLLPLSFTLFLNSSVLHYRKKKHLLIRKGLIESYLDEVSFHKLKLLFFYTIIWFLMRNILVLITTISYIQMILFLIVMVNRGIVKWVKV
jgi:hypothetical protein